jgi:AraC-like DNA-binding protein
MLNLYDFILNSNLYKKFKVNDLLFCEYKCPIEDELAGSWSHNNFFVYVLSGKKKVITRKAEYMLDEGTAMFVKKGASIVQQYFEVVNCILMIHVPDDFIKNVIEKHQLKLFTNENIHSSDKIIPLNLDEVLETYFQSVLSYFPKPDPPPENLLRIKFEELIIYLLSNNNNPELVNYFKDICSSNKISIREMMEDNFSYNLRLDEYARLCGRSLAAFKRDFEKTFETSPGKWLIDKRLLYAKFLLENSDKTIDEIIFLSGF